MINPEDIAGYCGQCQGYIIGGDTVSYCDICKIWLCEVCLKNHTCGVAKQ